MTPEALLTAYPEPVAALADRLRALVRETIPGATERVYPGWRAIGYRDAQAGYFAGVFPRATSVRLLFEHGRALADPDALFTGGGSQTRWIELRPGGEFPAAQIARLLEAAVLHGSVR